jgi:hypothetical protein
VSNDKAQKGLQRELTELAMAHKKEMKDFNFTHHKLSLEMNAKIE